MRLILTPTLETPPAMPRLRTPDGSYLAWSDDADLAVADPLTFPESALLLRRPHCPAVTLATGAARDMAALAERILAAISEAEGSDIVDVGALVGVGA